MRPRPEGSIKDSLAGMDPGNLRQDQLVWVVGRAATIGVAEERFWRAVEAAIADVGENKLRPSDVTRLLQAFAYAPREAPVNEQQIHRLLRAFARRVEEYTDEQLMRA